MAAHISADGEGLTRSAQSAAQSAMRGRLGRQHHAGRQRTITKIGKSDCEGTFAGASGNDENAPIPDARKGGLPPANSTLIADLRRGEHIVSDLPEVNIGELSAISAVIAVCCA